LIKGEDSKANKDYEVPDRKTGKDSGGPSSNDRQSKARL